MHAFLSRVLHLTQLPHLVLNSVRYSICRLDATLIINSKLIIDGITLIRWPNDNFLTVKTGSFIKFGPCLPNTGYYLANITWDHGPASNPVCWIYRCLCSEGLFFGSFNGGEFVPNVSFFNSMLIGVLVYILISLNHTTSLTWIRYCERCTHEYVNVNVSPESKLIHVCAFAYILS